MKSAECKVKRCFSFSRSVNKLSRVYKQTDQVLKDGNFRFVELSKRQYNKRLLSLVYHV